LTVLFASASSLCYIFAYKYSAASRASSGIGLRIIQTLASNGFYVYAGGRKAADLQRLNALENWK